MPLRFRHLFRQLQEGWSLGDVSGVGASSAIGRRGVWPSTPGGRGGNNKSCCNGRPWTRRPLCELCSRAPRSSPKVRPKYPRARCSRRWARWSPPAGTPERTVWAHAFRSARSEEIQQRWKVGCVYWLTHDNQESAHHAAPARRPRPRSSSAARALACLGVNSWARFGHFCQSCVGSFVESCKDELSVALALRGSVLKTSKNTNRAHEIRK